MGLYKVDETTADLTLVAGLPSAGDVMDFKYINVTLDALTSASGWTAPYAGIMMVNIPGNKTNAVGAFYVNGTLVSLNGTAENLYRGSTFAVPKGGVVTVADMSGSNNFYAVFAYITGNAVVLQNNVYSTTETLTNKVWIDGKPIYKKVFNDIALPEEADIVQANNRAAAQYTDAFPANYISNIVSASFVIINRTYGNQYSLPRRWESTDPTTSEPMIVVIDASIVDEGGTFGVKFETRSNRTTWNNDNYKIRAIVEYTKTTD